MLLRPLFLQRAHFFPVFLHHRKACSHFLSQTRCSKFMKLSQGTKHVVFYSLVCLDKDTKAFYMLLRSLFLQRVHAFPVFLHHRKTCSHFFSRTRHSKFMKFSQGTQQTVLYRRICIDKKADLPCMLFKPLYFQWANVSLYRESGLHRKTCSHFFSSTKRSKFVKLWHSTQQNVLYLCVCVDGGQKLSLVLLKLLFPRRVHVSAVLLHYIGAQKRQIYSVLAPSACI
jgi:Tat protein secretion system quality control protein TatD with DNase activity